MGSSSSQRCRLTAAVQLPISTFSSSSAERGVAQKTSMEAGLRMSIVARCVHMRAAQTRRMGQDSRDVGHAMVSLDLVHCVRIGPRDVEFAARRSSASNAARGVAKRVVRIGDAFLSGDDH